METPQQMPIDMNIPGAPMRRAPSELSLSGNRRLLGVTRDELHPNSLTTIFEELINPTARDLEWEFAASGYSSTTPPPSINTNMSFDIDNYYLREGELSISVGYPAPPSKNEEIVKCKCKRAFLIVNKISGLTRIGHKECGYCAHNVIEKN
jgi:hypothetical protein